VCCFSKSILSWLSPTNSCICSSNVLSLFSLIILSLLTMTITWGCWLLHGKLVSRHWRHSTKLHAKRPSRSTHFRLLSGSRRLMRLYVGQWRRARHQLSSLSQCHGSFWRSQASRSTPAMTRLRTTMIMRTFGKLWCLSPSPGFDYLQIYKPHIKISNHFCSSYVDFILLFSSLITSEHSLATL